jgi:uncharacterized protein (DUF2126 family)
VEGGTTSRFVDTSMQRLEFCGDATFHERYRLFINGRPLALRQISTDRFLSGLRYRRTNLYPSMHPGIPTQLPLQLTLVDSESGLAAARFEMRANHLAFRRLAKPQPLNLGGRPCRGARKSDLTCDLRLD